MQDLSFKWRSKGNEKGTPGKGVDRMSDAAGVDEIDAAVVKLNQFMASSSSARSFSNDPICE
jgi:hypothetical protein